MGWSLNIGKIFGIRFRIHITFFLLILYIFISVLTEKGFKPAVISTLFMCCIFLCVLIHEIGHSLIARRFGKEAKSITLLPIGGVAVMEELPEKPLQEIAMSAIGPLINLTIAALIYLFIRSWSGLGVENLYPDSAKAFLTGLIGVNIILAFFNLIPAFPMDGGRIFRGILALKFDYMRATKVAVFIGQAIAMLFIFYGILSNWWLLALIGFFLYIGAGSEKQQAILRSYLNRVSAGEAMATELINLHPDEPVSAALEHFYHGFQQDFPVIDNQTLVGLLTRDKILAIIRERNFNIPVADVMDRNFISVGSETALSDVYKYLISKKKTAAAVVDDGMMKGIICLDGISRYLTAREAMAKK